MKTLTDARPLIKTNRALRNQKTSQADRLAVKERVTNSVYVWERPVRIFHWVNALAIVVLMITGIYIGHPFITPSTNGDAYYSFTMGWVRDVHFFTAFIFTMNLIFRAYWTFKGNHYAKSQILQKDFWLGMVETIKGYLFIPNHKPHYIGHNPLAQLTYWLFIGLGSVIMVFTGYYMLFQPQPDTIYGKAFAWVPFIFGGSDFTVRSWHHLVAWAFMFFIVVHVYLSFREDWLDKNGTMSSIFTGYKFEPLHRAEEQAGAAARNLRPGVPTAIEKENRAKRITILGIGNSLYSDEGLGVQILPRLIKALKGVENLEFIDGTTEGMQLLGPVEATDSLIIIDAVNAGKQPGEIIKLEKEQIPSFNGIKMSVHQIGFQEVISAAQLRDRLPERMVMFGIQPASLQLGVSLTGTAEKAVPELVERVKQQIDSWRGEK